LVKPSSAAPTAALASRAMSSQSAFFAFCRTDQCCSIRRDSSSSDCGSEITVATCGK